MIFPRATKNNRPGRASIALLFGLASIVVMFLLFIMALRLRPDARRTSADNIQLNVYCAAGVARPVEQLVNEFNALMGTQLEIVRTGGSGELAGQIATEFHSGVQRGADLCILADDLLLENGQNDGLFREVFPLAVQKPVIAVAAGSEWNIQSLDDLVSRPDIAYGLTSERAAIGKMARAIAKRDQLLTPLEANRKTDSENVMTLAQALITGSLDAAIVWDTTVNQLNQGSDKPVLEIAAYVDPQDQIAGRVGLAVLATSSHPTLAIQFARFMSAPDTGSPAFHGYGFVTRPGDPWEEVPEVHLFMGSMFTPVLEERVRRFGDRQGVNIYSRWEGCGKLVASINSIDDPELFPDAFFACDAHFMKQVQGYFQAPITVSSNDIVMAIEETQARHVTSPADLLNANLRIGLCDPEQSALGWLTQQLLSSEPYQDLYEKIQEQSAVTVDAGPTLVSQLSAGGLDVAFVYRSNVMADPQSMKNIKIIPLSQSAVSQAIQPWAISKSTKNPELMRRLFEMIISSDTMTGFEKAGFSVQAPEKD